MAGQTGPGEEIELRFPSDPKYVAVARAVVEQAALAAGLGEALAGRIVLGLGEAVANVIRHCYGGRPDREIVLTVVSLPDRFELRLQDFGRRVHPEELRGRDLDRLEPGGLGLHIIRGVMDQVDLSFVSGTGNCLTMVKFLGASAGESGAFGEGAGS